MVAYPEPRQCARCGRYDRCEWWCEELRSKNSEIIAQRRDLEQVREELAAIEEQLADLQRVHSELREGRHIPKLEEQVRRECAVKLENMATKLAASEQARLIAEKATADCKRERDEALAKLEAVDKWAQRWLDKHTPMGDMEVELENILLANVFKTLPTSALLDLLKGRDECLAVDTAGIWCPDCEEVIYSTWNGAHEIGQDHLGTGRSCNKAIQPVTVTVLRRDNEGGEG